LRKVVAGLQRGVESLSGALEELFTVRDLRVDVFG
jgi:hypothetical protein